MQRIDFFRLERPIQERFVASAQASAPPLPLAIRREPVPHRVLGWAAVAAGAMASLLALSRMGFGELESRFALHPTWMLGVYAAIAITAALSAHRAFALLAARRALPYVPGIYLFPSGVIDTRDREFLVRPLGDVIRIEANQRTLLLVFGDRSSFRFSMPTSQQAEGAKQQLDMYRQRLGKEAAPTSARELAVLDPLCDNGFKNPFSPVESMRPPSGRRFNLAPLLALLLGVLLGAMVFGVRNRLAEDAVYRAARAADTRAAYLAYLERGGRRSEVPEILLPRTELAEIVAAGSLEALQSYASTHETSKIASEIDIALQAALRVGLEQAGRPGTLTALKDFAEKHGKHSAIAGEVERAIEEHWQARLLAFEQSARPKPEVREFFRRLLAYTSVHGSRVELRFRRRLPESVERAETLLRKSLYFGGEASLPAQYFDRARAARREEPVAKELLATLSQAFPKDLLDFQLAPPLEDSDEDLPEVKVPTLLVTHRTEMSGAYLMRKPRAALTGLGVLFRVTFQIPNDPNAHLFKYSSWNAPDLKDADDGKPFEEIYDDMAVRAFGKLPKRYLTELLPGLAG